MFSDSFTGLDRKRLRRWLSVFFLALAIPTGILVYQAYSQLKWEAFHQYRVLAEELAARIDARIIPPPAWSVTSRLIPMVNSRHRWCRRREPWRQVTVFLPGNWNSGWSCNSK